MCGGVYYGMAELRAYSFEALVSKSLSQAESKDAGAGCGGRFCGRLLTGLECYDASFGGLNKGLHILMGPPECGLTTVALQIALNVAMKYDIPVVYLAWSDCVEDLALRAASAKYNVPRGELISRSSEFDNCSRLLFIQGSRAADVQSLGLFLDKRAGGNTRGPVTWLLVIDYLQVMGLILYGTTSPWATLASLAFDLRSLAWEQGGAVLALSNLARVAYREGEVEPGALPKGSGDLEYMADSMILLEHSNEVWDAEQYVTGELSYRFSWLNRETIRGFVEEAPVLLRREYSVLPVTVLKPRRYHYQYSLLVDKVSFRVASKTEMVAFADRWCDAKAEEHRRKKGYPFVVTLKPLPARLFGQKTRDLIPDSSWSTPKAVEMFEKYIAVLQRLSILPEIPEYPELEKESNHYSWKPRNLYVDTSGKGEAFKRLLCAIETRYPGLELSEVLTRIVVALAREGEGP